jgi:sugar fermentation stimulation protein A
VRLFSDTLEARFLDRPNRFLVRALAPGPGGKILSAHCANPGRMRELLLPGAHLLLEPAADSPGRKTAWTLAAARYRGKIIPLRSVQANRIAAELLIPRLFPDLISLTPEVTRGRSRFDFLVRTPREESYLEVKACTLVEEQTAMFPDAPSARALRHLEELAELSGPHGRRSRILVVVMNPEAKRFLPNIHTDPAFSRRLLELRERVDVLAASIRVDECGNAAIHDIGLPVDFQAAEENAGDRGAYLLVVPVRRGITLQAGTLPPVKLEKGTYVYVGSAMKNLTARLRRHRRRAQRKRLHWHIDYLLASPACGPAVALPIRSARRLECLLASDLAALAPTRIAGFGSSDCRCPSHLFAWAENPLALPAFLDLLARYRHKEALRRESGQAPASPGARNPCISAESARSGNRH